MLGAAASTFYMNDVATILPKSIVAKTSAYFAGAAADVLEVEEKKTWPLRYSITSLESLSFNINVFFILVWSEN